MTQPSAVDDSLIALAFSISNSPGAYAFLLGAGVSAPSGIPTAWGVLEDLAAKLASAHGETAEDPVAWYETKFAEEVSYEGILERLAPSTVERQRILQDYFVPPTGSENSSEPDRRPTDAHRSIAQLVNAGLVRVIVTLNFDRLMEQALRDEGIEPTVIASPDDVRAMAPLHTLQACVIHLHGDYLNPASMLNTRTELAAYKAPVRKLLDRVFEDHGLVVAGWSATYDPALRKAIKRSYSSHMSMTWIEPHEQSQEAHDLLTLKRGALIVDYADHALGLFTDATMALSMRHARHPLTIAAAVSAAKRDLMGSRVAIGLHDRLQDELERLAALPELNLTNFHSDAPHGGYEAVLNRVMAAASTPAALVATAAYWGTHETDAWWLDDIERLARAPRGSGLVSLMNLRASAAAALFYAAGVALAASKRGESLRRLLDLSRPLAHGRGDGLLAGDLAADSIIESELGTPLLRAAIEPALGEALALTKVGLDEAWQTFEILRLARLARTHPKWTPRFYAFSDAAASHEQAKDDRDSGIRIAGEDREKAVREAAARRHQTLAELAWCVPLLRPHLFVAEQYNGDGYRVPVAERLAESVRAARLKNPFAALVDGPKLNELICAVTAVSASAGGLGDDIARRRLPASGGYVTQQLWIDGD